ncbi:hypothetical protein S7711_04254 [Stachybotrys chartarum IBT 7711]|uniref:tetrahydrofolate synthase n=1 Tax=Stachybotrys chartarum (strain CBS 109288 / IBT 7711) TaxID=1280523 RepID=A0A084AIN5_STACB|nr:hypothetical protein S7711_04254 [Stachybotrys chartarum IBT 7711]
MAHAGNVKTLEAKCHCGSVHFTIDVPESSLPLPVHLCHCSICRYGSGAPCVFHAPLGPDIEPRYIAPSSESNLTVYVGGKSESTWTFCSTCGCHVSSGRTGKAISVVSTSIFEDHGPENFQIRKHIFSKSAKDGGIAHMLTQIGGHDLEDWNPPDDDPKAQIVESKAEVGEDGQERLRAECRCGGVSFTIQRPSQQVLDDEFMSKFVSPLDQTKWPAALDVCNDCRLVNGTHVIGWTFVPLLLCEPVIKSDLRIGTAKTYASSPGVLRSFCNTCGATVLYSADDRHGGEPSQVVDIATGILRAPEGPMAEAWLTWRSRLAHVDSGRMYDENFTESLNSGSKQWVTERSASERRAIAKPLQAQPNASCNEAPVVALVKTLVQTRSSSATGLLRTLCSVFRPIIQCDLLSPPSYRDPLSNALTQDAIDALNSLQTPFPLFEARRKAGIIPDATFMHAMRVYLTRIGYSLSDLDRLNVVHVAGTKGKGSTCAFVDSILAQYQRTHAAPRKTGLFISPHLVSVRERIRINSKPISEDLFTKYFYEIWDRLGTAAEHAAGGPDASLETRPLYGRYLTLMSWHVFLQEGVDAAVYETGIGGEYDATNVVEQPAAAGITTLGIDHVQILGDSIEKISWHKAGIMKRGSPAFTVEQVPSAAQVLRDRADEKGVTLTTVDPDARLGSVKVRPNERFQRNNAALAVALAEAALTKLGVALPGSSGLPQEFVDGLEKTSFRGRCEVMVEDKVIWHLDGAHTADSLKLASKWFAKETDNSNGPRILIFNQQGRTEAVDFLESIYQETKRRDKPPFEHVIFCTNVTYAKAGYKRDFVNHQINPDEVEKMTSQRRFAAKWSSMDPTANVLVMPTIEQALDHVRNVAHDLEVGEAAQTLVTGSLHLVGGALGILEKADAL